jgi:ABC-type transporter Mla subunit MlaD
VSNLSGEIATLRQEVARLEKELLQTKRAAANTERILNEELKTLSKALDEELATPPPSRGWLRRKPT